MKFDVLTSTEIRQSFLDFFESKRHTIVPSSSLMPDSPNLLFTNAGMNQFVPIFLGERTCPYSPPRAADTQKCIRAGGKHNDLEDVGLDTYHHTLFEMLGNWSFGDYFKNEAIAWAWELVVERWKFPAGRLYATVYQPDGGDPASFDQEAHDLWAAHFTAAGLDPAVHIVNGNKKDNFWMMGDTGPCGPCSELHVDLTPAGDTRGSLVNAGDPRCIEIWNLVFIQFNANPDGSFSPLPAKHVDTGMGFERVTSIVQCTNGLTDFTRPISNYETDIFRPIFDELETHSGKKYASTLPGSAGIVPAGKEDVSAISHGQDARATGEQKKIDVAFRVIADHIRTLSFAIADGIQPGNTDRNYVLRRILRRAVRYGRTLGFTEPFFHRLVAVLARTMGGAFPEIRHRQKHIEDVIRLEEETFNRTLDRGIQLFEREAARLEGSAGSSSTGSAGAPPAVSDAPPETPNVPKSGPTYYRRRLPHFERPWAKYMITFATKSRRILAPADRDIVLETILHDRGKKYELYAACVMPDHVHILIEPSVKNRDDTDTPTFFTLTEILQPLKSVSSHRINKAENAKGEQVWENESFDRLIRSETDLEEKFLYICSNPRAQSLVTPDENYPWIWTPDAQAQAGVPGGAPDFRKVSGGAPDTAGGAPALPGSRENILRISGGFAFQLYDTYGFPLDLTELMARERGLAVDTAGFDRLMDDQRSRARAARKTQVIELSQIESARPTRFVGYDTLATPATVLEIVEIKDRTAAIVDSTTCYAEMGGQVGDTGTLSTGAKAWTITDTRKAGDTWLHFLADADALEPGQEVELAVDTQRRNAIQRHHTVTHLLHWALHEAVSRDASQKGSFVGPEKLTFDFNCHPLTPVEIADVERLVNERILENARVSWIEVPYARVKSRPEIQQFFGEKYGDTVRVVQIGGDPGSLGGYSMELCGGTHTRATGEIGLFRIASESAIAAGIRRIEAVCGLAAYEQAKSQTELIGLLAGKVNAPVPELDRRIDALLAQQKLAEKQLRSLQQAQADVLAARLIDEAAASPAGRPVIVHAFDGDPAILNDVVNGLKKRGFDGVALVVANDGQRLHLAAFSGPGSQKDCPAGKLIQQIAPVAGGKGGGKPDAARGAAPDITKLDALLDAARKTLGVAA